MHVDMYIRVYTRMPMYMLHAYPCVSIYAYIYVGCIHPQMNACLYAHLHCLANVGGIWILKYVHRHKIGVCSPLVYILYKYRITPLL